MDDHELVDRQSSLGNGNAIDARKCTSNREIIAYLIQVSFYLPRWAATRQYKKDHRLFEATKFTCIHIERYLRVYMD
jgi:hypothetical protein